MTGPSIADNLKRIREQIAEAALSAGREPSSVGLVAVSKTKSIELIREAWAAGQKSFGENYVQEAVEKAASLPEADWHFIGSLQTNKVKFLGGHFSLIHTLDRAKLADELNKNAERLGRMQDVLLQIRIGEEESKHGVAPSESAKLLEHVLGLSHLRVRGLMSLPPLTDKESVGRGYFAELRELLEKLRASGLSPGQARDFSLLSMGTSSDFRWAVKEGATLVRVGTSIFGARE